MGAIERYIRSNLRKGHSRYEIQSALKKAGYEEDAIQHAMLNVMDTKPFPWRLIGIVIGVIAAGVAIFYILTMLGPSISNMFTTTCESEACFIERANGCLPTTYRSELAGSTILYQVKDCTLYKSLNEFGPDEPEVVKEFFSNKEMRCPITQNAFDSIYLDGIVGGMDNCEGSLKNAILQLQT